MPLFFSDDVHISRDPFLKLQYFAAAAPTQKWAEKADFLDPGFSRFEFRYGMSERSVTVAGTRRTFHIQYWESLISAVICIKVSFTLSDCH